MKTGYKVCDAMTELPVYVAPSATIPECAKVMEKHHVGSLLIKEHNKLLGIITEQDIVRKALAKNKDPLHLSVSEIMETRLITVEPQEDIFVALKKMGDYNIRHLPVMHNGQMVGFLTTKDILKIEPQLFEILVDKIELKESGRKPLKRPAKKEGICEECGEFSDELFNEDGAMVCEECRGSTES